MLIESLAPGAWTLLYVFCTAYVYITIHELSHFAVSIFFKHPIIRLRVGAMHPWLTFYWRGIHFSFNALPTSGQVAYYRWGPTRLQDAITSAAGPASDILLGAAAWSLGWETTAWFCWGMAVINSLPVGGRDGKLILQYIRITVLRRARA